MRSPCATSTGYVSWGEYPMNFAAVLNQEEIYRLILAKGGNFDLQVMTCKIWLCHLLRILMVVQ